MYLSELKAVLHAHPASQPRLILPGGEAVPAHFHITEVGHVTKRFIDCGGTVHDMTNTCLLQTYVADDLDHRLTARGFARILDLGKRVLPREDIPVEVEYEDCTISQYPIREVQVVDGLVEIRLAEKHTDCLAKEKCGIEGCA
ncbi:MAG: hypothetical protein H0U43_01650, partial [Chthoniobacterales bacterium]|nr:hypothetical protein [Chthoniobacterales bacterium]